MATEETTEVVESDGCLSPIEVAKLADVRPQMVYNYITHGYIPAIRNEAGKLRVDANVAAEWVEQFLTRKQERIARKAAKLEQELAGSEA